MASVIVSVLPMTAWAALSVTPPSTVSFGTVVLSGTDTTTTASPVVQVSAGATDTTGWNLTLSTTAFAGPNGVSIPDPALSISSAPAVSCATSCTSMPTNTVTYAVSIPQAGIAVKWFNAASSTGIGTFTITPTLRLALPAKTYAGTYSATETYSVATGP